MASRISRCAGPLGTPLQHQSRGLLKPLRSNAGWRTYRAGPGRTAALALTLKRLERPPMSEEMLAFIGATLKAADAH